MKKNGNPVKPKPPKETWAGVDPVHVSLGQNLTFNKGLWANKKGGKNDSGRQ